jgi:hypothetical protein
MVGSRKSFLAKGVESSYDVYGKKTRFFKLEKFCRRHLNHSAARVKLKSDRKTSFLESVCVWCGLEDNRQDNKQQGRSCECIRGRKEKAKVFVRAEKLGRNRKNNKRQGR